MHHVPFLNIYSMFRTPPELLLKFLGRIVTCSPQYGTTSAFQLKYIWSVQRLCVTYLNGWSDLQLLQEDMYGMDEAYSPNALPSCKIKSSIHVVPCDVKPWLLYYIRNARHNPHPSNLSRHVRGGSGLCGIRLQCDASSAAGSTIVCSRSGGQIRSHTAYIRTYSKRIPGGGVHS